MGFRDDLDAKLSSFIETQHVFFVASCPPDGRINLSPKGLDTFQILGPSRVAYLDLTGSGNETAAHLLADGRITIMFCAFEGSPLILRLYGTGHAVQPGDQDWEQLRSSFGEFQGVRQIIVMDIGSVQTSCGFGVPLLGSLKEREDLVQWGEKKGEAGMAEYRQRQNRTSIDGLPTGLRESS